MADHTCPECGHIFSAPDWLGSSPKCPQCTGGASAATPAKTPKPLTTVNNPATEVFKRPSAQPQPTVSGEADRPAPGAAVAIEDNSGVKRLMARFSNDARLRSLTAGLLGGFLGWVVAEMLVGSPTTFESTVFVGVVVGVGIATLLGVAEGAAIGSLALARRGLAIGACMGAVGGLIGAGIGQATYRATSPPGTVTRSSGSGSFFSPEVARRIAREGGEAGEIEIALIWQNHNDLDLHVVDPSGVEIFYGNRQSPSGGWLDIDQNAGCSVRVNKPIEHVRWKQANAPDGRYSVYVKHYANCGPSDPTSFQVEIKNGQHVEQFEGRITFGADLGNKQLINTFTHSDVSLPVRENAAEQGSGIAVFAGVLFGWICFGAAVGCAQGFARKSILTLRNAAIGGAVGGAIGGLLLLIVSGIQLGGAGGGSHTIWLGRMLGFVIVGGSIGLFIVVVERALSATLVVRNGQYEGREIFLDKKEMRIGRNDALEVYLGGDPSIVSHHATIRYEGGAHIISSDGGAIQLGASTPTSCRLKDGDLITLGSTQLEYKCKKAMPSPEERKNVANNR